MLIMSIEGRGPTVSEEPEDELPEVDETIVAGLSEQVRTVFS